MYGLLPVVLVLVLGLHSDTLWYKVEEPLLQLECKPISCGEVKQLVAHIRLPEICNQQMYVLFERSTVATG